MQRNCSLDTGLECLVTLAHFHQTAASIEQLKHQFSAQPSDTQTLQRAAQSLGLKVRHVHSNTSKLDTLALPAIAKMSDGSFQVIARFSKKHQTLLIKRFNHASTYEQIKNDGQKISLIEVPLTEFESKWSGECILITRRSVLPVAAKKVRYKLVHSRNFEA